MKRERKGGLGLIERSLGFGRLCDFTVKLLLVKPTDTNESQKTLNHQIAFHSGFIDCDTGI